MSKDDWSSLDDDSIIASSDEKDSVSSSCSSSSESSSSESFTKQSISKTSTRVSTPHKNVQVPNSAEPSKLKSSARKVALESLVKRRRRSANIASSSSSSASLSEDDFLNDESVSEDEGPGFYSRVTNSMDKKDKRKSVGVSNGLSQREAFCMFVEYNALCLVSPNGQLPIGKLPKNVKADLLIDCARRIEKDLCARRDSVKPNYWKPDSELVTALNSYTTIQQQFLPRREWVDGKCFSCPKIGYSRIITFRGKLWDSNSLWNGDISGWLSEIEAPPIGTQLVMTFGSKCGHNCYVYHSLQHSKHFILLDLYQYICNKNSSQKSPEILLTELKKDDSIMDALYKKYERYKQISESQNEEILD